MSIGIVKTFMEICYLVGQIFQQQTEKEYGDEMPIWQLDIAGREWTFKKNGWGDLDVFVSKAKSVDRKKDLTKKSCLLKSRTLITEAMTCFLLVTIHI
jgi:hypothetical protein